VADLANIFKRLGSELSLEQTSEILKVIDANNDNYLDMDEWTAIMRNSVSHDPEEYLNQLKTAFNRIDTDGDGFINVEELTKLMAAVGQNLSSEDIELLLSEIDDNKDGKIGFEEFRVLMTGNGNESENED